MVGFGELFAQKGDSNHMVEFQIKSGAVSNVIVADHKDYEVTVDVLKEHLPNYFKVVETTWLVHTNYVKR
jgi:hypothetical protein